MTSAETREDLMLRVEVLRDRYRALLRSCMERDRYIEGLRLGLVDPKAVPPFGEWRPLPTVHGPVRRRP